MKQFLVDKYRPKTIEDYVFQNEEIERVVRKWIKSKDIPNIMMVSNAGQGKTTLSRIIVNELGVDPSDVLTVNASSKNGMEFIRGELEPWLRKSSFSGGYKVVQLEEFDKLSPAAQDALRYIIEDTSETARFIATANNASKITPAIESRFEGGKLNMNGVKEDDVIELVERVIEGEGIDFEDEDVVFAHIDKYMPDIRKIIHSIEKSLDDDNVLHPPSETGNNASAGDLDAWQELWSQDGAFEESDLDKALELTELVDNDNFDYFYTVMYENQQRLLSPQLDIIKIADYMYKASTSSANQRLNLDACLYHIFAVEGE